MYKAKSNVKLNIKTQQLLQKIQDQNTKKQNIKRKMKNAKYKTRNKTQNIK